MGVDKSARTVLWHLLFMGHLTASMARLTLNIAIVAMVLPRPVQVGRSESECFTRDLTNTSQTTNGTSLTSYVGFLWDEKEQGMVLGSYYWLFWLAQIPGGMLAQAYGGKKVFGWSHLICSLLCFLIPLSANLNIYALVLIRMLQGIVLGCQPPATHAMAGRWIPPNDRSSFLTVYLGGSIGAALSFAIQGLLIEGRRINCRKDQLPSDLLSKYPKTGFIHQGLRAHCLF